MKLLELASKLIEEQEKKILIEKVQDVWKRYRESLRPSVLTKADNEELHERARHLSLLLRNRPPKTDEQQRDQRSPTKESSSLAASLREEREDEEEEQERVREKEGEEEAGDKEEEEESTEERRKKHKKKKKEKDSDLMKKKRKSIKELETAVRTQGSLLRRFYDKSIEEIKDLQLKAGLHARALYNSLHKALWDHGALKPYKKRTGKNQQKATVREEKKRAGAVVNCEEKKKSSFYGERQVSSYIRLSISLVAR